VTWCLWVLAFVTANHTKNCDSQEGEPATLGNSRVNCQGHPRCMNRNHIGERFNVKRPYIGIHILASVHDRHLPKTALDPLSLRKDALSRAPSRAIEPTQCVLLNNLGKAPWPRHGQVPAKVALQPSGPDLVGLLLYKLFAII
jgi:hypothetical protein